MNSGYDLVCLSHLRWDFVFQRPQHLLSRCARDRRVFFVEEPLFGSGARRVELRSSKEGVQVAVPHLEDGCRDPELAQAELLRQLFSREGIQDYVLWYYTPMALAFSRELAPLAIVYDCMDQLSAFKNAPASLADYERQLIASADLVFTGGASLFDAKKSLHPQTYLFPSSVDAAHFGKARAPQAEPEDQRQIPHPRLGFFGVVDERMDLELLAGVAAARPDYQLVVVGPVVKISEGDLPRAPNLHYLGSKSYAELPSYISGWDVALLPFARNASTEFISPTKTPEYLAAGKPVVSTSIRDVVRTFHGLGLVHVADTVAEFVSACDAALREPQASRLIKADAYLSHISWDKTWRDMQALIDAAVQQREQRASGVLESPSQANNARFSTASGEK